MTKTSIEWTERVWNPIAGCSILSPGCTNCYAMKMAYRIEMANAEAAAKYQKERAPQYNGTTNRVNGNAVWTGRVAFSEKALDIPMRRKVPTTWFVNSMSDLFHESVPDEWIDKVFAVMALTPQHTYQVLTKRSARMRAYCASRSEPKARLAITGRMNAMGAGDKYPIGHRMWPLPNVWLGVSTERQKEADERIPDLLATPAAVRFISAEPLLGPIELTDVDLLPMLFRGRARSENDPKCTFNALTGATNVHPIHGVEDPFPRGLDWVICGGESGPGARPMHPDWARSLRDQCQARRACRSSSCAWIGRATSASASRPRTSTSAAPAAPARCGTCTRPSPSPGASCASSRACPTAAPTCGSRAPSPAARAAGARRARPSRWPWAATCSTRRSSSTRAASTLPTPTRPCPSAWAARSASARTARSARSRPWARALEVDENRSSLVPYRAA